MMHQFLRSKRMRYIKVLLQKSSSSKMLAVLFLFLFTTHTAAMMILEDWSLEVALWFTVTAGTTVGFGDYSPASTMGRLATVFLIYVPAIPTIALLTGRFVEKIISRRERKLKGNWKWNMSEHIVFVNFPNRGGNAFFAKILEELENSCSLGEDKKAVIVTDKLPEGLPQKLVDLDVKLVTGRPNNEETLLRASIDEASSVVILCEDPTDSRSDSLVFDVASLALEMMSPSGPDIIAEAILESTKARLKKLGVANVIRPIRAYPELVARTIISPGAEQIIENLFNSSDEECLKFPCEYIGVWADLVVKLVTEGHGTPIAVETAEGTVRANLIGSDQIHIKSVFLIVPSGKSRDETYFEQDLLKTA